MRRQAFWMAGLFAIAASPLWAEDGAILEGNELRFTIGVGAEARPEYFGSSETVIAPSGQFSVQYLRLGDLTLGQPGDAPLGLGFGGSFRIVPERRADDHPELAGLADVDLALELGGSVSYLQSDYELFGRIRYGVVGHEAFVGELGADVMAHPTDALTLTAGPRAFWGSDRYSDTYFGVTPDAASVSAFDAYDPGEGLVSIGVEVGATYQITEDWGVEGSVRWDRFVGDAADSPITEDNEAVSATIMATRSFAFEF